MIQLRISVVFLGIALVNSFPACADDASPPADIVRAIVEADVAGESMVRALSKLQRLDDAQKLVAAGLLSEATKSNLERPRINAINGLARLGSHAATTAPRLIEALQEVHETPTVRALAAAALSRVGADPKVVVPVLASALKDSDRGIREEAAFSLSTFLPADLAPVSEQLVSGLKNPELRIRIPLIKAAGRAGAGGSKEVIDPLIALLNDSEMQVRLAVIEAVGQLHEAGAPAVDQLATILHDSDRAMLCTASMALARIGEPAQGTLGSMLQAGDRADLRAAIALLKYKIGQTGQGLAELKDAANHASGDWQAAVAEIGAPAVPMLSELLDSRRTAPIAIDALARLGPAAKDALSTLRRVQASSDASIRTQALAAIQLIDQ